MSLKIVYVEILKSMAGNPTVHKGTKMFWPEPQALQWEAAGLAKIIPRPEHKEIEANKPPIKTVVHTTHMNLRV